MPRYFLQLPHERTAREWNPHGELPPAPGDTRYFGGVFREMEKSLRDPDIKVYMTWDAKRLPAYGADVVAVLLCDDGGVLPRYLDRVRAVFKCYGTHPTLGTGPLRNPGRAGFAELGQYALRWLRWIPGGVAHAGMLANRSARSLPALADISTIPLGTLNQLDLPVAPIEQRSTDLFFAGSIEHRASLRRRISPKAQSRREMLAAARRLAGRRADLRVDLRVTSGFEASAAASPASYSSALMDARACLAPRGASPETFRVLEGMRAGCVIVGERLPGHWFYEGAPILQLDRWRDLEAVLLPVLDDPAALADLHERTLSWWSDRCSEAAVGSFLAQRLNEADGAGGTSTRVRAAEPAPGSRTRSLSQYYSSSSEYRTMLAEQDASTFSHYVSYFTQWAAPGSRLLDVGCGVGTSTRLLREAGFAAHGTDPSARFLPGEDGFFVADFTQRTELPDGSFAAVGALNVLEHVADPQAFLSEMVRVLEPGGVIVLSSPNLTSPLAPLAALVDLAQGRTPYLGLERPVEAMALLGHNLLRSLTAAAGHDSFAPRAHALHTGIVGHDVDAIYWSNSAEVARHLERLGCELLVYGGEGRTAPARVLARTLPSFAGQIAIVARRTQAVHVS